MGSIWKKVIIRHGGFKLKIWHVASILILGLLVYYYSGPGFAIYPIRNTNVSVELGSLKSTRNIVNSARTTVSGKWELSGTSSRVDPDDANSGLPDLQISIRDFSVSGAKKDKSYNYDSDSGRMRATVSLHDFSYTVKVECESDRGVLGDTESAYYWYDVDLSMRIRADGGWVGFESISMSDVKDDSNQVDLGDVSRDKDFDYGDIGSGSKDPSDYGLQEHCTAILRIKRADDNSGKDSYTASAKISGQIIVVTAKEYIGGGGETPDYTPESPEYPEVGVSDLSDIVTLLGGAIVVLFIFIVIIVIYAVSRKR